METVATPRQTRLRLNKLERRFRANVDRFTPEDQVLFRYAFEIAEKAGDADTLAEMLRATLATEAGDEPT